MTLCLVRKKAYLLKILVGHVVMNTMDMRRFIQGLFFDCLEERKNYH